MRLNRTILTILTIIVLTLASTSPATAGNANCQKVYSTLDTLVVEDGLEVGQVEGVIDGAAYLRYDDTAPSINPRTDPPNLVITSKLGVINLWVYSELTSDGNMWWRYFQVLRSEGAEGYAGQRIILNVYGMSSLKEGSYEIEGKICSPNVPPKE